MAMRGSSGANKGLRLLLLTLLGLMLIFAWLIKSTYGLPSDLGREVNLNRLYDLADAGQIVEAKLLDEDALAVATQCASGVDASQRDRCSGRVSRIFTSYPRSDVATQQLIERLTARGADVEIDKQTNKAVAKLIITFVLPLMMLANLFGIIFMSRGGDSSIADIAGFGTIRKKKQRQQRTDTGVTFSDVAGADVAVAELREVVDYLTNPEKFEAYGAAVPKGVLLFGPPGTGKTLMARAVAGESGVPFFSVSGTEFVESLVGVGAARVRDLFRQVREVAPAIVFIDEIDAVGRKRTGEGISGGEREQTVNQLLVEMDGFEPTSGIVVIGATNRPDILDPGLLRPGRFDRHVTLTAPDPEGRKEILQLHAEGKPISDEVDFDFLAKRTPGFTGADLANVINEAALLAIRGGEDAEIKMSHLGEAILRVIHGPQRKGHLLTVDERRRIAYHEAGHAVVAASLGKAQDIHRVSILSRGRALGHSVVAGDGERALLTADDMQAELTVAMGGIAAEVLIFGNSSTTSEDDIEKATGTAREMVGIYGMSGAIGRVRLLNRLEGFLEAAQTSLETASGQTMQDFDQEVKNLIRLAERKSGQILEANRRELDRLAADLVDEETIEGPELERQLSGVIPAAALPDLDPEQAAKRESIGSRSGRGTPSGI